MPATDRSETARESPRPSGPSLDEGSAIGPIDSQYRYLVHFDDRGSGMRHRDEPLRPGDALGDGGGDYVIERVEPAPGEMSFGHAWAVRLNE